MQSLGKHSILVIDTYRDLWWILWPRDTVIRPVFLLYRCILCTWFKTVTQKQSLVRLPALVYRDSVLNRFLKA